MKKLMFTAAALCASVGFCSIESANIVGYQGQKANATRNTMMAPTFLNVGSETGCKLSDLTVTGYDAPEWDEEEEEFVNGCGHGEFVLNFLNNNGTASARYYWVDDGETGPAWCDQKGNEIDASKIDIAAGVASWVIGNGMTLQSAGQVCAKDIAFKMNPTRNTACGNCMPTDLKLADIVVTGYGAPEWDEEEEEFVNGCGHGEFVLNFLLNNGTAEARYYWVDDGETGPCWCNQKGAEIDATQVSFPAGKGAWIIGNGMTLNIPSPIAD